MSKAPERTRPTFDSVSFENEEHRFEIIATRLHDLLSFYDISEEEEDRFHLLSAYLAIEFIPNFDPAKKRGRKESPNRLGSPALVLRVEALKKKNGLTAKEAAETLSRTRAGRYKQTNPKTIESRVSAFRHLYNEEHSAIVCPSCKSHYVLDEASEHLVMRETDEPVEKQSTSPLRRTDEG